VGRPGFFRGYVKPPAIFDACQPASGFTSVVNERAEGLVDFHSRMPGAGHQAGMDLEIGCSKCAAERHQLRVYRTPLRALKG
jgi:hypothetical protein